MRRLDTITVGGKQIPHDSRGQSVIQAAIDALADRNGGTVLLLPGTFTLTGPVRLRSNVRLVGSGAETVLRRGPAVSSFLAKDADIGQKEITPQDPSLFTPGMGVICRSRQVDTMQTMPLTITRICKGVLYLNDYITSDFIAEDGGLVANVFPLVHGFEVTHAGVENLVLDGAVQDNPGWSEVWSGGIYLRRGKHCIIRRVTSINHRGDGIRCGQSEHTVIEDCEAARNTHYGIHPGSHSPWTTIRRCHVHHNGSDGIYICWGVREGKITHNNVHHNGFALHRNGFCIGHKDTDCLVARNHIYLNAKHGIHVRKKTLANGAHRCVFRNNVIENNGRPWADIPADLRRLLPEMELSGCGMYLSGITHDLVVEKNIIRDTRRGRARTQINGIYVEKDVVNLKLRQNTITGHPGKRMAVKK